MRPSIALALFACLAAPAAWAQGANPAALQTAPGISPQKPRGPAASEPPPSAVPGARAEPAAVAPVTKNAIDLPPNEALFDAINRGDLPVAKDAVNRGADLSATNVLGLTPIELAVDLGRNQISFYLLSLRGGVAGTTTSAPPNEAAPKPLSRAERIAEQRAQRAERAASARPALAEPIPAALRTARLFAGGGGAPVPQAGFLGFDANR